MNEIFGGFRYQKKGSFGMEKIIGQKNNEKNICDTVNTENYVVNQNGKRCKRWGKAKKKETSSSTSPMPSFAPHLRFSSSWGSSICTFTVSSCKKRRRAGGIARPPTYTLNNHKCPCLPIPPNKPCQKIYIWCRRMTDFILFAIVV